MIERRVTLLAATTALLSLDSTLGFSPPTSTSRPHRTTATPATRRLQPLKVGLVMGGPDGNRPYVSQDEAWGLMERAKECANSDSCSLEDASDYLHDVLYVQSDCVSGALHGKDLCENQDTAAEIVSQLRAKIAAAKGVHPSMVHGGWTAGKQLAGFTLLAGMVMMLSSLMVLSSASVNSLQLDASPFTMQEWWWAIRDGYLPTMMEYYFRHGGLIDEGNADAVASAATVVPFTLQEIGWAIQGGYLPKLLAENFQHGGFMVDAATAAASSAGSSSNQFETVALTPQEWIWAAQGGYLDTLVAHVAKNGGLATGGDVSSATPFTAQEWQMAAQGGYLNTMIGHFLRNGGV